MTHPDTPARLKKELDTVLALQAELDTSNRALQMTRTMFGKETTSDDTLEALESLEKGHTRLMDKVETLYMSLNLSDRFPELEGVDLNFVRTLLMARDLKINIRKRAIASFFEWDKLDRAVGGAQQTLGNISRFSYTMSSLTSFRNQTPPTDAQSDCEMSTCADGRHPKV